MIRVVRHAHGPRLYLVGRRVHHGSAGLLAAAVSYRLRRHRAARVALLVGLSAAAHDARDFPFRDIDNHEPRGRR